MPPRSATADRKTTETQIALSVDVDGSGRTSLATGIPLFDHMLEQLARHGMLDLDIRAKGDLQVDAHHTVEDVGITLGQAVARAVGDKKGIRRYGHAYVPLDEALSRVVIDFSGRPGLEYHVQFKRALIGEFDVDLVHEFFQVFANPGQGAMPDCMREMDARGLRPAVLGAARERPFLGICIGLQMLFESSDEGDVAGLSLLRGKVRRFPAAAMQDTGGRRLKVPHMGWNQVRQERPHVLWSGIENGSRFYFVHSYFPQAGKAALVQGTTYSGVPLTGGVARDTIFAV